MYNIPVLNPMLFLILFFTLTLLFLVGVFLGKKNSNGGGGTDENCEFDRACPVCHKLLKKIWANCPYCGHKED